MNLYLQIFLSGLALGASVCGAHCCVLLVPVVARNSRDWRDGIKSGLLFGAGKVVVYAAYGGIAAWYGYIVHNLVNPDVFAVAGGVVLMLMSVWFFFYRGRCARLFKIGSPLLLGLVDGVVPCGITLGFFLYIAGLGGGVSAGVMAGVLFGLGSVTVPIMAVCGITPYLWRKLSRFSKAGLVLRLLGAMIFFLWALSLMLPVFM